MIERMLVIPMVVLMWIIAAFGVVTVFATMRCQTILAPAPRCLEVLVLLVVGSLCVILAGTPTRTAQQPRPTSQQQTLTPMLRDALHSELSDGPRSVVMRQPVTIAATAKMNSVHYFPLGHALCARRLSSDDRSVVIRRSRTPRVQI